MPAGRPSLYTEAVVNEICEGIACGRSLVSICKAEHMPHISTVFDWLVKHKEFSDKYTRARETQADVLADEILDIADNSTNDYMLREGLPVLNDEHMRRTHLRLESRKWLASKLKPKKYSERHQVAHTGEDGGPVKIETDSVSSRDLAKAFLIALGSDGEKDAE